MQVHATGRGILAKGDPDLYTLGNDRPLHGLKLLKIMRKLGRDYSYFYSKHSDIYQALLHDRVGVECSIARKFRICRRQASSGYTLPKDRTIFREKGLVALCDYKLPVVKNAFWTLAVFGLIDGGTTECMIDRVCVRGHGIVEFARKKDVSLCGHERVSPPFSDRSIHVAAYARNLSPHVGREFEILN